MSWRVHLDDVLERRRTQMPSRSPSPAAFPRLEHATFMPTRPRSLTPTSARSSAISLPSCGHGKSSFVPPLPTATGLHRRPLVQTHSPPPVPPPAPPPPDSTGKAAASARTLVLTPCSSASARAAIVSQAPISESAAYAERLGHAARFSQDNVGTRDATESSGRGGRHAQLPLGSIGQMLKAGVQPRASPREFRELPAMLSSSSNRSPSPSTSAFDIQTLPLDMQKLVQTALQQASSYHNGNPKAQHDAAIVHAAEILSQHNTAAAESYASRPTPSASHPAAASYNSTLRNIHSPASVPFSPHVGVGDREAVKKPSEWSSVIDGSWNEPGHHVFLRNVPVLPPSTSIVSSDHPANPHLQRSAPTSSGWLFAHGSTAASPRSSDEAGRAGARDQHEPKSQAALATIEQTQHVHGDSFGVFKQQQPVRAAFPRSIGSQSNASVRSSSSTSSSSSAAAGKSLSASAVPSRSASASAPKAASTTQSHLPPRIIHLVGGVAASGSSGSRRASVSFAPAATEHLFTAAVDRDDSYDDDAAVDSSHKDDDLALTPVKLSVPPPPPSSSSSASLARVGRGAGGSTAKFKAMLDSADDNMVAMMMDGMDACDYTAAFEQGAIERLAGVVSGSNDAIAWRVLRKMFIHLKSSHGTALARAFVQHNLVDAALDLLVAKGRHDTVEVALWCLTEAILIENFTHQLRQQGAVLSLCTFLTQNVDHVNVMRVAVELLLLLIDGDVASQRVVHDVLGVKFLLLRLINVEIQRGFDFDDQYIQDALLIVLNTCVISDQGALDIAAVNGVDMLLYLCESRPNLVLLCMKIVRLIACNHPDVVFSSLVDRNATAFFCRVIESGVAAEKDLVAEIVARMTTQYRSMTQLKNAGNAAQVAAVLPIFQSCGIIPMLGQCLAPSNKQGVSGVARGWAIQALLDLALTHEGNIREMREGGGGAICRDVRLLKSNTRLLSDTERAQVLELDAVVNKSARCCVIS